MPYINAGSDPSFDKYPVRQKSNWGVTYPVTSNSIDFTGCTVVSEIRDPRDPDTLVATFTCVVVTAEMGVLTFTRALAADQIDDLVVGRFYESDVLVIFPAPDPAGPQPLFGPARLCVLPAITAAP